MFNKLLSKCVINCSNPVSATTDLCKCPTDLKWNAVNARC